MSQNCWCKIRMVDLRPRTWGDLPSPKILTYKLREMLSKCGSYVRVIDLSSVSYSLDHEKTLQVIAQFCPNLRDINISSPLITSRGMNALARKCKKLERLFLYSSSTCPKPPKLFLLANIPEYRLNVCENAIPIKCLYNLPVDTMRTIILENWSCIDDYDLSTVSQVLVSFFSF